MVLTEKLIHSLSPSKQTDYFHKRTPRAGIRATKGGRRKSFFIFYLSPQTGKGRRAWIGEHTSSAVLGGGPYLSLNEFEAKYVEYRQMIQQGVDPLPIIHGARRLSRNKSKMSVSTLQKMYANLLKEAKKLVEMAKESESIIMKQSTVKTISGLLDTCIEELDMLRSGDVSPERARAVAALLHEARHLIAKSKE